ncbi:MAG TPA: phasin family protein [Rhizomicrobium sp.]|jgi:hypothetical protein|nr:phasin family protein [Rhizomicrobium sp.]
MARAKRQTHHSGNHFRARHESEHEIENESEEMENAAQEIGSAAREQFRRMQHNGFGALDVFGGPMARLMDQNWSMFQKMMHAMREESLEFVNRRLEQTSQAIESSRDCDGVTDLLAVQQDWVVNFARDYAEQTKRFAELVRDIAEDGTARVSRAASEVAERGRDAVDDESHRAAA